MIELSSKTIVGRKLPLRELMKTIKADKATKEDAKKVESVVLTNVLSKDTLNAKNAGNVREVFVVEIVLKDTRELPKQFLTAMDRTINMHTVFVLRHEGKSMLCAAIKEKGDKGIKVGKYHCGEWRDDKERLGLPPDAIDVDGAYAAIWEWILPLKRRQGESAEEYVARHEKVQMLNTDAKKLQRAVDAEVQPKLRFEYNAQLKAVLAELEKETKA